MAKPKPDFTVGRNMDHPHLKGRFTLRIWIPAEETALVISKCGQIKQQDTNVKSIDCPVSCCCLCIVVMMLLCWWRGRVVVVVVN